MNNSDDADIYLVASYPKSGATWFKFLIYVCVHGKLDKSLAVGKYYPEWFEEKLLRFRSSEPDRLFVKSHLPYSAELPLKKRVAQCIYLSRNPLDVLASKLNHYVLQGNAQVQTERGRNKFFDKIIGHADAKPHEMEANDAVGGWNHHVLSWLKHNTDIPTYIIRYEDLRENTCDVMRKLNRDLNLGFTDENIVLAVELASFERLRALEKYELDNEIRGMFFIKKRIAAYREKEVQFVNKGKVGNYKSILDVSQMDAAIANYSSGLKILGYHFDGANDLIL